MAIRLKEILSIHEMPYEPGIYEIPYRNLIIKAIKNSEHASIWTFYDEREVRDEFWHPQKGEVVIDVGAAFGSYSIIAGLNGALVICFEPNDKCFELLSKNIELNKLNNNVLAFKMGIWKESGKMIEERLYAINSDNMKPFITSTIDEVVSNFKLKIDWIKIDTESAEADILKGAKMVIKEHKPKILIECHTFLKENIDIECESIIKEITDYKFTRRPYCSVMHMLCEPKEVMEKR